MSNRPLILSHSLLAGAAGLVPIPFVDDLLADAVRAALLRRIAEIHKVDVDPQAIAALRSPHSPHWSVLGAARLSVLAIGGTRRMVRRLATSLLLMRRADEAVETFQVATLFDHYCARHHVGLGLDGDKARRLRHAIERAIARARGEALQDAFRRALESGVRMARRVPRSVRALLRRSGPVEGEAVEQRIQQAAEGGFVRRAVETLDAQLEQAYLRALERSFDATWAEEPS
jgi:hypothetical protein